MKYQLVSAMCILSVMGCLEAAEPTNQELCEASDTCQVVGEGDSLGFECIEDHKWEDADDAKNFTCVTCDEGMKWATNKADDLTCVPICRYPETFNNLGMVDDCADNNAGTACDEADTPPPYAWNTGVMADGTEGSFNMEEWYCDEESDEVAVLIVLVATWCGYCPDYLSRVDNIAGVFEAMGGRIIYVVEDPTDVTGALNYVNNYIGANSLGLRVSDQHTKWIYDDGAMEEDKPGTIGGSPSRTGVPTAFIVKRDDLKVIATQGASQYYLDFIGILEDIKAGVYDNPL